MAAVLLGNSTELSTQPSKATDFIVMSKDSRDLRSNAKQHLTLFEPTDEKDVENLTVSSEYMPTGSPSHSEHLTDFFFTIYEGTSKKGSRSPPAGQREAG